MRSRSLLMRETASTKRKIHRHQLVQREQLHDAVVNFDLQFVDGVFLGEHAIGELPRRNRARNARPDGRRAPRGCPSTAAAPSVRSNLFRNGVPYVPSVQVSCKFFRCDGPNCAAHLAYCRKSTEAAGDVRLCSRIAGRGEQLRRGTEFDQLAGQQERGEIADARGLLHVVRDDGDRAEIFQLNEKLFDFGGADGIERGARLIQQQNFGLDGQRARDTQTLLLAAGQFVRGFVQLVFHFIPQRGVTQALFDGIGERSPW